MTDHGFRTRLRIWLFRASDIWRRGRRERRLAEELAAHLDELADGYEARGMTPQEARAAARRAFGGVDQVTFDFRQQRGLPMVDAIVQDVLFAIRLSVKDRWFTVASVIALALGSGVSTTVFTMINGIALQPLPVDEPDRIVHLLTASDQGRADSSYPELLDWQRASSFTGLAGYAGGVVTAGDRQQAAERVSAAYVSWNTFDILREQPIAGRSFHADDDRPGADAVVILSHAVWSSRYGSDPRVVGRTMRLDGTPATIVGVMREGFRFPMSTDVWQPLHAFPGLNREARDVRNIGVFGRLADAASIAAAQSEMAGMATAAANAGPATARDARILVMPFTERFGSTATASEPLLMLFAVSIILVIACTNAALLLLARAAPRAREVALRAAMGASRGRIVRQLLIETLLLSVLATGLGFAIAVVAVRRLRVEAVDLNLPFWMQLVFDWRVLTFVAAVCLLTALGSGLAPAWHLSGTRASDVLKDAGRGILGGRARRRWSGALLVAELALTLTLLAGAGLLTRSARALEEADQIVDPESLVSARLAMPASRFRGADDRRRFFDRLEAQLAANPLTRDASLTTTLPFMAGPARPVRIDGGSAPVAQTSPVIAVSDGYFDTLGLQLLRGRAFGPRDGTEAMRSVIVNQRFVERYSPDRDAIGRTIQLGLDPRGESFGDPLTIVGVAPSFRQSPMRDTLPVVFVPLRSQPGVGVVSMVVRQASQVPVGAAITGEVRAVDPDVAVFATMSMQRVSQLSRFNHRMLSSVLMLLASIALFLSAIGLYGITAFGIAQRTSEIGIRIALGAARRQLTWHFVRRTLVQVAAGLMLGVAGAIALGQVISGFLIRTTALDPMTFGLVMALLAAVTLIACLIPAARATRLDPVVALRRE